MILRLLGRPAEALARCELGASVIAQLGMEPSAFLTRLEAGLRKQLTNQSVHNDVEWLEVPSDPVDVLAQIQRKQFVKAILDGTKLRFVVAQNWTFGDGCETLNPMTLDQDGLQHSLPAEPVPRSFEESDSIVAAAGLCVLYAEARKCGVDLLLRSKDLCKRFGRGVFVVHFPGWPHLHHCPPNALAIENIVHVISQMAIYDGQLSPGVLEDPRA